MRKSLITTFLLLILLYGCAESTTVNQTTDHTTTASTTTQTTTESLSQIYYQEVSEKMTLFISNYENADVITADISMNMIMMMEGYPDQNVTTSILTQVDTPNNQMYMEYDIDGEKMYITAEMIGYHWHLVETMENMAYESVYTNAQWEQQMGGLSDEMIGLGEESNLIVPAYGSYSKVGERYVIRFSVMQFYNNNPDLFLEMGLPNPDPLIDARNSTITLSYTFDESNQSIEMAMAIGTYTNILDASIILNMEIKYLIGGETIFEPISRVSYFYNGMMQQDYCTYVYDYDGVNSFWLLQDTINYYKIHFDAGSYHYLAGVYDTEGLTFTLYDEEMRVVSTAYSFDITEEGDYYLEIISNRETMLTTFVRFTRTDI